MNTSTIKTGFTLVEVLVGIAIMGVVLLALMNFFGSSTKLASQASSRAELQQETLNAQQLIAGRLREAWYIYPPGTQVNLGNGLLRRNPNTNKGLWTVGQDPILVMLSSPKRSGGTCVPNITQTLSSGPDFCWRVYAYHPVRRSVWLRGTLSNGKPSASHPGATGPQDATLWVLAEFRKVLPNNLKPTQYPPAALPELGVPNDSNLLSDFLSPSTDAAAPYAMFTYQQNPENTGPVVGVGINLAVAQLSQGKVLRLPSASGTYQLAASPTNLGKLNWQDVAP